MDNLTERFHGLDDVVVPDVWTDAASRTPRPLERPPLGARLAVMGFAAIIAIGGLAFAFSALREGAPSVAPITSPLPSSIGSDAPVMIVHGELESVLRRLWTESALIDELEGEVQAAFDGLQVLNDEIGTGIPTEEQAKRRASLKALIARFEESVGARSALTETLRARVEWLRERRDQLVSEADSALFPTTAIVTCTGDGEGGTSVSTPAVLAENGQVRIRVMNALSNELVFLDLGTRGAPIEVAAGGEVEHVLDVGIPQVLEIVCTYDTPPQTWQRPAHHLTVVERG